MLSSTVGVFDIIADIAVTLTFVVVVIALAFTMRQLKQADRARHFQSVTQVFAEFSTHDGFLLRERVLELAGKDPSKFNQAQRIDATMTTDFWQRVAIQCERDYLEPETILRMYSKLILIEWDILKPFIQIQREDLKTGFAKGFERLAMSAEIYRADKHSESSPRFNGAIPRP